MADKDNTSPLTVTCLYCGEAILELIGPVFSGGVVEASLFRGVGGYPDPIAHEPMECPNCGLPTKEAISRVAGYEVV